MTLMRINALFLRGAWLLSPCGSERITPRGKMAPAASLSSESGTAHTCFPFSFVLLLFFFFFLRALKSSWHSHCLSVRYGNMSGRKSLTGSFVQSTLNCKILKIKDHMKPTLSLCITSPMSALQDLPTIP